MRELDRRGRPLQDLRISVTDRCNFRCAYCTPRHGRELQLLPHADLLTFEEMARLARVFVTLGVQKVRLTGGEPLVRPSVENLVALLADIPALGDIAMTTNGALLTPRKAKLLREAGLHRVTISLDALDEDLFSRINGVGFPARKVLEAVEAAATAGLTPIKINMVVKRGLNDDAILDMAGFFRKSGHVLRFIEYMDAGNINGWRPEDVVPAAEILARIGEVWPLEPLEPTRFGEVATRYRYLDGQGEIGVVASVTQPFCRTCTRARLSPEGQLFTCLFGHEGTDLRALLRDGRSDAEIGAAILDTWHARSDHYSELRTDGAQPSGAAKVEMFHIGG